MQQNLNFTYVITISPIKEQEAPPPSQRHKSIRHRPERRLGTRRLRKLPLSLLAAVIFALSLSLQLALFTWEPAQPEPASLSIDCTEQTRTADQSVVGDTKPTKQLAIQDLLDQEVQGLFNCFTWIVRSSSRRSAPPTTAPPSLSAAH